MCFFLAARSQLQFSILVAYIALLFFSYRVHVTATNLPKYDNLTDLSSLLAFKSAISSDPHGALSQWNDTGNFCQWNGITCDGPRERVVALQMASLDLVGVITPALANLTLLATINLSSNHFSGPIPRELARLPRLQNLQLGYNSLDGIIPPELGYCAGLQLVDLSFNMLGGSIPSEFGSLSSLHHLDVSNNSITGEIPPQLANASSLHYLDLWSNQLSGDIPPSLCTLSNLTHLELGLNNLQGSIPPSLWNLSSLRLLVLDANRLFGSLPQDMSETLPNLQFLSVPYNELHGEIPLSLPNMSRLDTIQLQENNFSGTIPRNLGNLQHLRWLNLGNNQLKAREPDDWSFLASLSNCTVLEELPLHYNNLGGLLPKSIANLSSSVQFINIGNNYIYGNIPPDIGNLVNLTYFDLGPNFLTGSIPDSLGLLRNLHIIDLSTNNLSGEIPSSIGNLSLLNLIFLDDNRFHGSIPSSIGNCKSLELLDFSRNKLTGTIPRELLSIPTISRGLSLEGNLLTGSIPSEVGSLSNLGVLDLSGNKLSGEIPSSLGKCQVLQILHLDRNFFSGSIPTGLSTLRGLQELNLSQNNLSGQLPHFLEDLPRLYYLGLSLNNFEGEVPVTGVFANLSAVSVQGNNMLCGGKPMLHLPPCTSLVSKKKHNSHILLAVTISITSVFLFLILLIILVATCYRRRQSLRRKPIAEDTAMEQIVRISYAELVSATDGFSEANVIGSGSFGIVYKGILHNEHLKKTVAVKVFNLQQLGALKSFIAECDALRNIRHRNLIKILTACSSTDYWGNDFKAMVFEFMANGSLESWLHSEPNDHFGPRKLNLIERLNIAVDVASALSYLHYQGQTPIVHCDLKPSNILLDEDMTAIVTDFGLARFIEKSSQSSTSSLGMRGTIGYIAPEYGMANKVSTHGDVYSFGILLLELFTGKRPTDDTFKEGLSLRTFVEMALPEQVVDVMDVCMPTEGDTNQCEDATYIHDMRSLNCVSSVLTIGLLCTKELTIERIEMTDVTRELHAIRNKFLENRF